MPEQRVWVDEFGPAAVANLDEAVDFLDKKVSSQSILHLPRILEERPLSRRIIVVRGDEEYNEGRIIIPDIAKTPLTKGYVLSCGPFVGTHMHDRAPGGWHRPKEELILREVVFGLQTGREIHLEGKYGRPERTAFLIMVDYDLWHVRERGAK